MSLIFKPSISKLQTTAGFHYKILTGKPRAEKLRITIYELRNKQNSTVHTCRRMADICSLTNTLVQYKYKLYTNSKNDFKD